MLIKPPGASGRPPMWDIPMCESIDTVDLDWRDRGLGATIARMLDGQDTRFGDTRVPPAETSRIIWCVALFLARFVETGDLCVDDVRGSALEAFVAGRPTERNRHREPSARLRHDHSALAALAPSAWALAFGDDQEFRNDLLDRVVVRLRAPENRQCRIESYTRLPSWLRSDVGRRVRHTASHRLLRANLPARSLPCSVPDLRRRIPQMLWPTVFEQSFAPHLGGLSRDSGRTLCSILLLRLGPCTSLKSAALLLGQRGTPAICVAPLMMRTDKQPLTEAFSELLQSLNRQLQTMTLTTDYSALRAHYEHCVALDARDAARILTALSSAGCFTEGAEDKLMSVDGRTALALWIWIHATHSRFDKSPKYGSWTPRRTALAVASISRDVLNPNREQLFDYLEGYHGMPLREPCFQPLP